LFKDTASEERLRGIAFSRGNRNFRFDFANGDYLTGVFCVARYERDAPYDGMERFAATLQRVGASTYTAV
jgi:predicted secreted protein